MPEISFAWCFEELLTGAQYGDKRSQGPSQILFGCSSVKCLGQSLSCFNAAQVTSIPGLNRPICWQTGLLMSSSRAEWLVPGVQWLCFVTAPAQASPLTLLQERACRLMCDVAVFSSSSARLGACGSSIPSKTQKQTPLCCIHGVKGFRGDGLTLASWAEHLIQAAAGVLYGSHSRCLSIRRVSQPATSV